MHYHAEFARRGVTVFAEKGFIFPLADGWSIRKDFPLSGDLVIHSNGQNIHTFKVGHWRHVGFTNEFRNTYGS
jgi:hypothetical protein